MANCARCSHPEKDHFAKITYAGTTQMPRVLDIPKENQHACWANPLCSCLKFVPPKAAEAPTRFDF